MGPELTSLSAAAQLWIAALERAAWQGGLALGLAWAACRFLSLSGGVQSWIWRVAYLRLLTALLWPGPLALPLLPADGDPGDGARARAPLSALLAPAQTAGLASTRTTPPNPGPKTPDAATILLLLWLTGAGWRTFRLVGDARATRRLCDRARTVQETDLLADLRELTQRLRLRSAPLLLASEELSCPLIAGAARPAVLLPSTARERFTRAQLRLMLGHELTHVRRRDLLWAWLPNLGRILFFFHPVVWLAEAEWRLAHEMACDEQAVVATNAPPTHYAAMLLAALAQWRRADGPLPEGAESFLRAGVVESYATLRRRLIAVRRARPAPPWRRVLCGAILTALAVAGALPWRLTARAALRPAPGVAQVPELPRPESPRPSGSREALRRAERRKLALLRQAPDPVRLTERTPAGDVPDHRAQLARPLSPPGTPSEKERGSAAAPAKPLAKVRRVKAVPGDDLPETLMGAPGGHASGPPPATETPSIPKYSMVPKAMELSNLEAKRMRAWREKLAVAGLLYVPKPIVILPEKLGKEADSPFRSDEALKKPVDREAQMKHEANRLLALDPASRVQVLAKILSAPFDVPERAVVGEVMQHLTDDERRQVKETVGRELDRRKLLEMSKEEGAY